MRQVWLSQTISSPPSVASSAIPSGATASSYIHVTADLMLVSAASFPRTPECTVDTDTDKNTPGLKMTLII